MQANTWPELWAGLECTINRVGDRYFKQLEMNGHLHRASDIDLFASLQIKRIRYPVLWEQIAPGDIADADWSWSDDRLQRLRDAGICPIVGFVHHGSGPAHTSLVSEDFPGKLACYAKMFAARYPWVKYYTPVNEPLTTARFSGLYGHWYPHGKDNGTFLKALTIQCAAIVQSMQAIRSIIPDAQLVQTEDICKTFSTPLLAYQADFENERRWLSLDLLCGRINDSHPLWDWLHKFVPSETLQWFIENTCVPDIVGVNHYITSDRFLDELLCEYPSVSHGGNGLHDYADVEATSAHKAPHNSLYLLLKEVYTRYELPIAVTEAHLCSGREEMLRWFKEFWDTAVLLRKEQVDIRAVTAWSLLGSFDWNCLVTACNGFYEPGVYDLRGNTPRPTAIAHMLAKLGTAQPYEHPVLATPGAWRRPGYAKWGTPSITSIATKDPFGTLERNDIDVILAGTAPVLLLGANGALGNTLRQRLHSRHIAFQALTKHTADITDPNALRQAIQKYKPWAVINASGYTNIDMAECYPQQCRKVHVTGVVQLAELCHAYKLPLLTFSSAHVFDGQNKMPYNEASNVCPPNVYGQQQAEAEARILSTLPGILIVRGGQFFSPGNDHLFLDSALSAISKGIPAVFANDQLMSFSYLPDFADTCLDLLIDQASGIWHVAHEGHMTPAGFAYAVAKLAGMDNALINGRALKLLLYTAPRPAHMQLATINGQLLPPLHEAIMRYAQTFITACTPQQAR